MEMSRWQPGFSVCGSQPCSVCPPSLALCNAQIKRYHSRDRLVAGWVGVAGVALVRSCGGERRFWSFTLPGFPRSNYAPPQCAPVFFKRIYALEIRQGPADWRCLDFWAYCLSWGELSVCVCVYVCVCVLAALSARGGGVSCLAAAPTMHGKCGPLLLHLFRHYRAGGDMFTKCASEKQKNKNTHNDPLPTIQPSPQQQSLRKQSYCIRT